MCVKYPRHGQLRLLFTDTDSLAYAVQREDIYREIWQRDMAEDPATHYGFMHTVHTVHMCKVGLTAYDTIHTRAVQNVKWCGSRETIVATTAVQYSPQLNTHECLSTSVAVIVVGGCTVPTHTHTCSNQG